MGTAMTKNTVFCFLVVGALLTLAPAWGQDKSAKPPVAKDPPWQEKFAIADCGLTTTGRNDYFVLEPGFQTVLEGKGLKLVVTVLDETQMIDGSLTRVVEEREWKDGALHEVARNFFAMCKRTKDVFYFGEEVDFYKDGKVVDHAGSWIAGKDGARAGLMMPGKPKAGMRYYQEIAPGVAMDRAEIIKLNGTCQTPAGTFGKCLITKETTALDSQAEEYKSYAPGIGRVHDGDLLLTKHGFAGK
jgi:hypothetical protein